MAKLLRSALHSLYTIPLFQYSESILTQFSPKSTSLKMSYEHKRWPPCAWIPCPGLILHLICECFLTQSPLPRMFQASILETFLFPIHSHCFCYFIQYNVKCNVYTVFLAVVSQPSICASISESYNQVSTQWVKLHYLNSSGQNK